VLRPKERHNGVPTASLQDVHATSKLSSTSSDVSKDGTAVDIYQTRVDVYISQDNRLSPATPVISLDHEDAEEAEISATEFAHEGHVVQKLRRCNEMVRNSGAHSLQGSTAHILGHQVLRHQWMNSADFVPRSLGAIFPGAGERCL
jgi:hypothetical protein